MENLLGLGTFLAGAGTGGLQPATLGEGGPLIQLWVGCQKRDETLHSHYQSINFYLILQMSLPKLTTALHEDTGLAHSLNRTQRLLVPSK